MTINSYKAISISMAFLMGVALIWGFRERGSKHSTQADLDKERLKSESLLSEKLSVEKERDRSNRQAFEAKAKNDELASEVASVRRKLEENSLALQKLSKENSSSRKKYELLLAERKNLEGQLTSLAEDGEKLREVNHQLSEEVVSLRSDNQKLQDEMRMARLARYDKPLITARGSTNKLVIKASRVRKLRATLSVSAEAQDLKFTVIDPKGTALTEKDGAVTSRIISSTAGSQQLEITFSPKKKLQPGLYQIEVVSGEMHVGSLQVSLR